MAVNHPATGLVFVPVLSIRQNPRFRWSSFNACQHHPLKTVFTSQMEAFLLGVLYKGEEVGDNFGGGQKWLCPRFVEHSGRGDTSFYMEDPGNDLFI